MITPAKLLTHNYRLGLSCVNAVGVFCSGAIEDCDLHVNA